MDSICKLWLKQDKTLKNNRVLRTEVLEERALLSAVPLSSGEYAEITAQYSDFNLPDTPADLNIITLDLSKGDDLSDLKSAIATAGTTTKSDLIVVRTSETANAITYTAATDEITIDIDATQFGSITLIGLGNESLTLDANQLCRVMTVSGENTVANLGGITITGGYLQSTEEVSACGAGIYIEDGTINLSNSLVTGNEATEYFDTTGQTGALRQYYYGNSQRLESASQTGFAGCTADGTNANIFSAFTVTTELVRSTALQQSSNTGDYYGYLWTGYFAPSQTGTYQFSSSSDDVGSIWIDINQNGVFDNEECISYSDCTTQTGTASLTEGEMYAVALSMQETDGEDYYHFKITPPGGTQTYILGDGNQGGVWSTGTFTPSYGGGIYAVAGVLNLTNTLVEGNSARLGTDIRKGDAEIQSQFAVTTLDDIVDPTDGVISLREAVTIVSDETTIAFADSLFTEENPTGTILLNSQLNIDNPMTIDGAGKVTLDGQDKTRIINNLSTLELVGLTFTRGNADIGGAIKSVGNLMVKSSSFHHNTATGTQNNVSGGSICAFSPLSIDDSEFRANSGGTGGAIGTYKTSLTVTNSRFLNNVSSSEGGAIKKEYGTMLLDRCVFTGNTAGSYGGTVFNVNDTATICNSAFWGNKTSNGAGIYNYSGNIWISNTTIAGNKATIDGGGIFRREGVVKLNNSIVTQNYAPTSLDISGVLSETSANNWTTYNPLFVCGPVFDSSWNLTNVNDIDLRLASYSPLINSLEEGYIGAYEFTGEPTAAPMDFSIVTTLDDEFDLTNDVISLREAIWYVSQPDTTITFAESLFGEEESITLALDSQLVIDKPMTIDGAGKVTLDGQDKTRIINNLSTLELVGLTFTRGKADIGGAIKSGGSLIVKSSSFHHNTATGIQNYASGGSIYAISPLSIDDSEFSTNSGGTGGAIGTYKTSLTVTNSRFLNNVSSSEGGAIKKEYGTMLLDRCVFTGNTASSGSGSVFNVGDTATICNSTFFGNKASINGAGIYNYSGNIWIYNTTIAGNKASNGGGIYRREGVVNLNNSIVTQNYAPTSPNVSGTIANSSNNLFDLDPGFVQPPVWENGVLTNDETNPIDLRLTAGSVAINMGRNDKMEGFETDVVGNPRIFGEIVDIGAYEYQGNPTTTRILTVVDTLNDSFDFSDDEWSLREALYYANSGDTITFDDALLADDVSTILLDSQLTIDKTIKIDGAEKITLDGQNKTRIINNTGSLELIGLTLTHGYTTASGAAIYNTGTVIVRDCDIVDNETVLKAARGGAIYNSGTMEIWASRLNDNKSTGTDSYGGVLYNTTSGKVSISGTQLIGNSAKYGGALFNDGAMTIATSELVSNSATTNGGAIYARYMITIANSTIVANSAGSNGGGVYNERGVNIYSSILYQNRATTNPNSHGTISVNSYNLIDSDPGFVCGPTFDESGVLTNRADLDLSLSSDSPAIDAGYAYFFGQSNRDLFVTDAVGNPRIVNAYGLPRIDIGAYEYQFLIESDTEIRSTVVTTLTDVVDPTDDLISLREAIAYADYGMEITFADDIKEGTILLSSQLDFDKVVTIDQSSRITLDGQNATRLVYSVVPLEFTGWKFINGKSDCGGAIYTVNDLTITDCLFTANTAIKSDNGIYGGAIYSTSTLNISGSRFEGNQVSRLSDYYRSALCGGAIYTSGTATITNTDFVSNQAKGFYSVFGGAIYNSGTLTVEASEFSGNKTTASNYDRNGGAIYNAATATITNSTFSNNSASDNGGAIWNGSSLTVTGSEFSGNTANNGGAIWNQSTATLTNVTVANNTANNQGGGIWNNATLNIDQGLLYRNTASSNGGAIYSYNGTATLQNLTIAGNQSSTGGGIYRNQGTVNLNNSIVALNNALTGYNVQGELSETSSNNWLNYNPLFVCGPVYSNSTLMNADAMDFHLSSDSPIINSLEEGYIGYYDFEGEKTTPTVDYTVVTTLDDEFDLTNEIVSLREAIYQATENVMITFADDVKEGTILLSSQLDFNNVVTIDQSSRITLDGQNATRLVYSVVPLEFTGWKFINGKASNGGGIYTLSTLELTDCELTNNVASSGNGGAIYTVNDLTITDCLFTANTAIKSDNGIYGGAIYSTSTLNISGSRFEGNQVSPSSGSYLNYLYGGAIYTSGTATITNTDFVNNQANGYRYIGGGAIYNSGTLTVEASEFSGNSVTNAWACRNGGAIYNAKTATITNSTFSNNAADQGGALWNSSSLTVTGSEFSGNTAGSGGAIWNQSTATLTNVTIANNTANSQGGGIWNNATLNLYNTIVVLNTCNSGANINGTALGSNNLTYGVTWGAGAAENREYYEVFPLFVDAANRDYRTVMGSLAFNNGSNERAFAAGLSFTSADIGGRYRFTDGFIDIGAHECYGFAQLIELDKIHTGKLTEVKNTDYWSFTVEANTTISFDLISGSFENASFALVSGSEISLLTAESGQITLTMAGVYYLKVSSLTGAAGAYAFRMNTHSMQDVSLDETLSGTMIAGRYSKLYSFTTTVGESLQFLLTDLSSQNRMEMYLSYGEAPTRAAFDMKASNSGESVQKITTDYAPAGTYYVLVYGDYVPVPSDYTLSVNSTDLRINEVIRNTLLEAVTDVDDLVISLDGFWLENIARVELIDAQGVAVCATGITVVRDYEKINATFDSSSVPAGTYSVRITNESGKSTTLKDGLVRPENERAFWQVSVDAPSALSSSLITQVYVTYTNTGNIPLIAPLVTLSATQGENKGAFLTLETEALIRFAENRQYTELPDGFGHEVSFLADGAYTGMLMPGESVRLPVYFAGWLRDLWSDFSRTSFTVSSHQSTETTRLDWGSHFWGWLTPEERIANAEYITFLNERLGQTWGEHVIALNAYAADLSFDSSSKGKGSFDLKDLQKEVQAEWNTIETQKVQIRQTIANSTPCITSLKPVIRLDTQSNGVIQVSWISIKNTTGYRVRISTSSSFNSTSTRIFEGTSTSSSVELNGFIRDGMESNLVPGENYYVQLQLFNSELNVQSQWTSAFKVSYNILEQPTISEIKKDIDEALINLKWNAVSNASDYDIWISTDIQFPNDQTLKVREGAEWDLGEIVGKVDFDITQYRLNGSVIKIDFSKDYYVMIRAVNDRENLFSDFSEPQKIALDSLAKPVIEEITIDADELSIHLEWNAVENASGYLVQVSTFADFKKNQTAEFKVSSEGENFNIKQCAFDNQPYNLQHGITYYVRVIATNEAVNLESASDSKSIEFMVLDAPVLETPKVESSSIHLQWNDVDNATNYMVFVSTTFNFETETTEYQMASSEQGGVIPDELHDFDVTTFMGKDLVSQQMYYFKIVAVRTYNNTVYGSKESNTEGIIFQNTHNPGTVYILSGNSWKPASEHRDEIHIGAENYVIIHGNSNSVGQSWVTEMGNAIKSVKANANILAIDWGAWAKDPTAAYSAQYIPAVAALANHELFGNREFDFTNSYGEKFSVIGLNLDPENTHIIGHSHGGHVAGLIGMNAKYGGHVDGLDDMYVPEKYGTVKRITGLDISEEKIHWMGQNSWGAGWGPDAASFVEFYKSSALYGGETAWGNDNFLVTRSKWDDSGDHSYAYIWFTKTIRQGARDGSQPGFWWNINSQQLLSKKVGFDISGSWLGLIVESDWFNPVFEGVYENKEYYDYNEKKTKSYDVKKWNYSGADSSETLVNFLKNAYELQLKTNLPDEYLKCTAGEENKLKIELVDNSFIDAVLGRGNGNINISSISLSYKLIELGKEENTSISVSPEGKVTFEWTVPSLEELEPFDDLLVKDSTGVYYEMTLMVKLDGDYYELYSDNDILYCPVRIYVDGIVVDAGANQTLTITQIRKKDKEGNIVLVGDDTVSTSLQGSAKHTITGDPKDNIKYYYWEESGTGVIRQEGSSFGGNSTISGPSLKFTQNDEGVHSYKLYAVDSNNNSASDDVVITVKYVIIDDFDESPQLRSVDPNEILGPSGFGEKGWTTGEETLAYQINYENDSTATAPAQRVDVEMYLDEDLDWSTFQFTGFGWADVYESIADGAYAINKIIKTTVVPLDDDLEDGIIPEEVSIFVEVTAGIDLLSGRVWASFQSLQYTDLDGALAEAVLLAPTDVNVGFLLPSVKGEDDKNIDSRGDGFLTYIVQAKSESVSGTEITSIADIQFDYGEIIATNQIDPHDPTKGTDPGKECLLTIDVTAPTANLAVLAEMTEEQSVTLNWTGADEGSGIASYAIYVSSNGGNWEKVAENLTETTYKYQFPHKNKIYSFKVVATDNVGLVEEAQSAEVSIRYNSVTEILTCITTTETPLDSHVVSANESPINEWSTFNLEFWSVVEGNQTFELSYDSSRFALDKTNVRKQDGVEITFGEGVTVNGVTTLSVGLNLAQNYTTSETSKLLAALKFTPMNSSTIAAGEHSNWVLSVDGTTKKTEVFSVPYDLNDDGAVGIIDLVQFARLFNKSSDASASNYHANAYKADYNSDSIVDILDLVLFARNFNVTAANATSVSYSSSYAPADLMPSPDPVNAPTLVSSAALTPHLTDFAMDDFFDDDDEEDDDFLLAGTVKKWKF